MKIDQPHISKKVDAISYAEDYVDATHNIVTKLTVGRDTIKEYMDNDTSISDDERIILQEKLNNLTHKIKHLNSLTTSLSDAIEKTKNSLNDYSELYKFFAEHADDISEEDIDKFTN